MIDFQWYCLIILRLNFYPLKSLHHICLFLYLLEFSPFVYVVYGARNASGALRRLARYNFLEVKQPKGLRILREQGLIFSDSTIILFLFGVLVQNLSLFSLVKKNQRACKVAFLC